MPKPPSPKRGKLEARNKNVIGVVTKWLVKNCRNGEVLSVKHSKTALVIMKILPDYTFSYSSRKKKQKGK